MYKKRNLEDLQTFKNKFFDNLVGVIKKQRCMTVSELLKLSFLEGDESYFFDYWRLAFRIQDDWIYYHFFDEREKIQISLSYDQKSKLNGMVKHFMIKGNKKLMSIEDTLYEEFKAWNFSTILDKPYLVYDIETTMWAWNQLDTYKFLLAYSMEVSVKDTDDGKKIAMKYEYIDQEGLKNFVQKLVDFDGYIVGFNSIAFDNPVSVLNVWGTQEQIDSIDQKSIDLFLFIWNLTGRRIGLNKVSESFIGLSKTLESGAQGEGLYQKYLDTGEKKYLDEFKKYCKNDVRMTLMVFLYLWYFKKIDMDEAEYTYTLEQFVKMANKKQTFQDELAANDMTVQQSIF